MNLELTNPFTTSFPEKHDSSIDVAALIARFNPSGLFAGHYLAVGRLDGVVAVLDFETKNVVRWLEGHVKSVTTVCWSHNSRYLLTASRDWNVIIWDLSSEAFSSVTGERRHTLRFDSPVTSAHLHPKNSYLVIVTLHSQTEPIFIDLRKGGEGGGRWELEVPPEPIEEEEENVTGGEGEMRGDGEEVDEEEEEEEIDEAYIRRNREIATAARFNPTGDLMYVGTNRGNINIWDVRTKEWLWTEYTGTNSAIKHLEFSPKGDALIVNSNDRILRLLSLALTPPSPPSESDSSEIDPDLDDHVNADNTTTTTRKEEQVDNNQEETTTTETVPLRPHRIPYFEPIHRFQDLVNRTPWNGCGFSNDGEYIMGGADNKGSHNIYIWDRDSGGLVKILEGPKDPLEDLDWHPLRPLIASTSTLGFVHTWITPIVENWAAYAPGFEELDENREYEEREDEFDIEDEDALKRRQADEQDIEIDIISTNPLTSTSTKLTNDSKMEVTIAGREGEEEGEYERWIALEPDGDQDETFCLAPELDQVPIGGGNGGGGGGNVGGEEGTNGDGR